MKETIRRLAYELGFNAAGFAPPRPTTWEHYKEWIKQNYHGEMGYLARRINERREPSTLLPDVKSVILVAKRYPCPEPSERSTPMAGYAAREDYHDVFKEKLVAFGQQITETAGGGCQVRPFVDSSPVMETDLAAQTGIGWKGKNTVLVSRSMGQYFLLGGLLTTLPLPPDTPHKPQCGSCTRCLDACPTHAFIAPYLMDARKCISYWTIEYKGVIPEEVRPMLGTHIFGCDDCIAVCPWNRFAVDVSSGFLPTRPELAEPDLLEWMRMDQDTFRTLFKGTPVFRLKRKRLLRNIAIALGNLGDPKAIPVLEQAVRDREELIRVHAEWALERLQ
jgi:epoxyqueuosine reductase